MAARAPSPRRSSRACSCASFLVEAKKSDLDYNIIEAFDEPWKIKTEGGVGAYWGIWNADRQLKPALQGTLVNYANWQWLAIATLALGLPFAIWMMRGELGLTRRRPLLRGPARLRRHHDRRLGLCPVQPALSHLARHHRAGDDRAGDPAAADHLPGRGPGDGGQSVARPDHAPPGAAARAAALEDCRRSRCTCPATTSRRT